MRHGGLADVDAPDQLADGQRAMARDRACGLWIGITFATLER
jgi:hypothetical protein